MFINKLIRIFFCLLLLTGVVNHLWAKEQRDSLYTILLLNSYHRGFKWSDDITDAVLNKYRDSAKYQVYVEYMDSKHFQSETFFDQLEYLYQAKYQNVKIDGIICSDNNAFDFVLQHSDSIWGKVPVVFCGINDLDSYRTRIDTINITGVEESIDICSTIKVAKLLQPDLKEFIIIGDKTLLYPMLRNQFQEAIIESGLDVSFKEVIVDDINQLKQAVESESLAHKAIYLLSLYINNRGVSREMATEAKSVFAELKIPVYGNWDFLMPDLIIGGRIISGADQGRMAASIMFDRLTNPSAKTSFYVHSPQHYLFDHKQLNRFGFNRAVLPRDRVLVNMEQGLFSRYRTEMFIICGFLFALVCIIGLLVAIIFMRRKSERELIESENRLELALEGANQGLWDFDMNEGSIFVNSQVAKLLGYDSPKALNLTVDNWRQLCHPQDVVYLQENVERHKKMIASSIKCEIRILTNTGKHTWFSIHGKITQWNESTPVRYTGSIVNIEEQKEFENQLRLAKEMAEESDRLKSSFLANMSHEIRTPMNAILGFADLVTTDVLSEEERQAYLNQIKSSGESLLNLINDIIDISKIESEQLVIVPEHFELNELLYKIEKVGQTLINNSHKSIKLIIDVDLSHPDSVVFSDSMRLEQVLLNLLTNAIKFTPQGKIEIKYRFVNDDSVLFSVCDTGIGIGDEYQKIIFERFRQGDESMAKKFGGNGLGLTISRSLVHLLGGSIDVSSKLGCGSCFSFSISTVPCKNRVETIEMS